MRENRPYGSEGGEGDPFPTPISLILAPMGLDPRIHHLKESLDKEMDGRVKVKPGHDAVDRSRLSSARITYPTMKSSLTRLKPALTVANPTTAEIRARSESKPRRFQRGGVASTER
jgi:hypothetical protein